MIRAAFICLFVTLSVVVFAGEPPKEPMLRIETGVHLAVVNK